MLNIHEAIPLSCDTFFYTLAQKLGIDTIAKYATEFGLGQKTGIDLPNEMAGVMPSTQWEMKNFHQRYYPGNTISVGIGQGETQVTPLQLARALGGIASDGHFVRPHVVDPDQLPANFRQAILDSFPGSGDKRCLSIRTPGRSSPMAWPPPPPSDHGRGRAYGRHRLCRQNRAPPRSSAAAIRTPRAEQKPRIPGLWAWFPGAIQRL